MTAETGRQSIALFGITCWEIQIFHSSELFTNDHEALFILELQVTFSKQEDMHIWNLQIMRMDCVCYIYYLCVRVCNCYVYCVSSN